MPDPKKLVPTGKYINSTDSSLRNFSQTGEVENSNSSNDPDLSKLVPTGQFINTSPSLQDLGEGYIGGLDKDKRKGLTGQSCVQSF